MARRGARQAHPRVAGRAVGGLGSARGMHTTARQRPRQCTCWGSASCGTGPATTTCCGGISTPRARRWTGPGVPAIATATVSSPMHSADRPGAAQPGLEGLRRGDPPGPMSRASVEGSVATVEEQAFHCLALERMAGDSASPSATTHGPNGFSSASAASAGRWDRAFWLPDAGFYAHRPRRSASRSRRSPPNPGHALGTGTSHAIGRVSWPTGSWSRTCSMAGEFVRFRRTPSFNPFAYHLGSVWPVEQATFALGFKRYGLDGHPNRLVDAVLAAAVASEEVGSTRRGRAMIASRSPAPSPIRMPRCPRHGLRARSSRSSRSCSGSTRSRRSTSSRSSAPGYPRGCRSSPSAAFGSAVRRSRSNSHGAKTGRRAGASSSSTATCSSIPAGAPERDVEAARSSRPWSTRRSGAHRAGWRGRPDRLGID